MGRSMQRYKVWKASGDSTEHTTPLSLQEARTVSINLYFKPANINSFSTDNNYWNKSNIIIRELLLTNLGMHA